MEKFKLPKKVDVAGFKYSVIFPYFFEDDPELLGLHSGTELEIKVSNKFGNISRNPQQVVETLLHETFHAIDFWCLGDILSENEITELSRSWFSVIKNNDIRFSDDTHIPSKVNIRGMTYKVHLDYIYDDTKGSSASVNFYKQEVYIGDPLKVYHSVFKKVNLITMINAIICDGNIVLDKEYDNIQTKVFSHAIYSTVKLNKFEEVIKSVK